MLWIFNSTLLSQDELFSASSHTSATFEHFLSSWSVHDALLFPLIIYHWRLKHFDLVIKCVESRLTRPSHISLLNLSLTFCTFRGEIGFLTTELWVVRGVTSRHNHVTRNSTEIATCNPGCALQPLTSGEIDKKSRPLLQARALAVCLSFTSNFRLLLSSWYYNVETYIAHIWRRTPGSVKSLISLGRKLSLFTALSAHLYS